MIRMALIAILAASLTLMNPKTPLTDRTRPDIGVANAETIYAFEVNDILGKPTSLKRFEGQVLLVVNVASQCGHTPQYEGLERLYRKYRDRGFAVLGFPANEFGGQEPGTNAEIRAFCTETYGVTFPMFSKIVVKGPGMHPLYKWLVANAPYHDEIEWNFAKFLVGRKGTVIGRFLPKLQPNDRALVQAIETALEQQQ